MAIKNWKTVQVAAKKEARTAKRCEGIAAGFVIFDVVQGYPA
jgi:hypothetical protein